MEIKLTYAELTTQLERKINKKINFGYVDAQTIRLSYPPLSIDLKVEDIESETIKLSVPNSGFATNMALKTILTLFEFNFICYDSTQRVIKVDTSQIEQLQSVYKYATLGSLCFDECGVNLRITLI